MIGPAEILLRLLWNALPKNGRELFARKLLLAQAKALIPLPCSTAVVYSFSRETASRFESGLIRDLASIDGSSNFPPYSLITTCFNEEHTIRDLLDSIARQTVLPKQVVICDGGSTDGTLEVVRGWEAEESERRKGLPFDLKVLQGERVNIAEGRNRAAGEASHDLLLLTDAGGTLDKHWAERLLMPFSDPDVAVAMGWYKPVTETRFERAMSGFIVPQLEAVSPETFLPSGRSLAIKKELFFAVGGYPTHLTFAGEDSLFDYYLKTAARKVAFVPDAIAQWRFPKGLKRIARTVFNYSRGDAESGFLFFSYYLSLLDVALKVGLETLAALLALIVGDWTGWSVFSIVGFIFLLAAFIRLIKLILSYRPGRGGRFDAREFGVNFSAVFVMVVAQVFGFLRGICSYQACEKRRIAKAPTGHLVLMLPHFYRFEKGDELTEFVQKNLKDGWYITIVYALTSDKPGAADYPFCHPQLESHLRSSFDLQEWLKKHQPFYESEGRRLMYQDYCSDSLSRELIGKLEAAGARKFTA